MGMGYPNGWMVYFMANPMKMDETSGYPHDLGNIHITYCTGWCPPVISLFINPIN